jgi:hypothetical protein
VELEQLAVGVGADLDAEGGAQLGGELVGDDVVVDAFLADGEEEAGLVDGAAGGGDFDAGVELVAGLGEAAELGFEDAVEGFRETSRIAQGSRKRKQGSG